LEGVECGTAVVGDDAGDGGGCGWWSDGAGVDVVPLPDEALAAATLPGLISPEIQRATAKPAGTGGVLSGAGVR
jgi:hypothetical protein